MSSLSDFAKKFKQKNAEATRHLKQKAEQVKTELYNEKGQEFEDMLKGAQDRFQNMNQQQLYSELFKEASRLKASGKFDYDALYAAVENMSPYIDQQQKQTMLNLLNQLK